VGPSRNRALMPHASLQLRRQNCLIAHRGGPRSLKAASKCNAPWPRRAFHLYGEKDLAPIGGALALWGTNARLGEYGCCMRIWERRKRATAGGGVAPSGLCAAPNDECTPHRCPTCSTSYAFDLVKRPLTEALVWRRNVLEV